VDRVGIERSTTERLHAALDGDREAWSEIVDEYTNLLWWIARSYRLDDATSADVVQTVWLRLVQHGRSIMDAEKLAGWLSTTARREALRRSQSSNRTVAVDSLEDEPDRTTPSAEDQVVDEELTTIALAAYRELGDDCRRLLGLLCEDEPKSYTEIAALLGTTPGYIGPTRQRCLKKLRTIMKGMGA
jgi:RNA polymerase sigma factor (sigma-70 family)